MKTTLIANALVLVTSASAKLHVERRATFNASFLQMDAHRYALDLDNKTHGTHAYGYRAGDRLLLRGSRQGFNGQVVVERTHGDVLYVRYSRARTQNHEVAVRLTIIKLGR